jgi:hypothetical protein
MDMSYLMYIAALHKITCTYCGTSQVNSCDECAVDVNQISFVSFPFFNTLLDT